MRLLVSEMYKRIPRKVIEEREIDELVRNPEREARAGRRRAREPAEPPDFETVKWEADEFIDNATRGFYFAPNRVVPKRQRPKWRFVAKRLYRDLLALTQDEEYLPQVSDLLTKIYSLLCDGCGRYLFTSDAPFRTMGISQEDFYRSVVAAKRKASSSREWVGAAVQLLADENHDYSTTAGSLAHVLLEFLDTPSLKEEALEQCERFRRDNPVRSRERKRWEDTALRYRIEKRNNRLVELAFMLKVALSEPETAVDYFKAHYLESSKETRLYVLLATLFRYGLRDLWVKEYEAGVRAGVKPRKALEDTYRFIEQTGRFPEYMGWG